MLLSARAKTRRLSWRLPDLSFASLRFRQIFRLASVPAKSDLHVLRIAAADRDYGLAGALSWIESSSISKMSVAFGPITLPAPPGPYASAEGIKTCHFEPTGIS